MANPARTSLALTQLGQGSNKLVSEPPISGCRSSRQALPEEPRRRTIEERFLSLEGTILDLDHKLDLLEDWMRSRNENLVRSYTPAMEPPPQLPPDPYGHYPPHMMASTYPASYPQLYASSSSSTWSPQPSSYSPPPSAQDYGYPPLMTSPFPTQYWQQYMPPPPQQYTNSPQQYPTPPYNISEQPQLYATPSYSPPPSQYTAETSSWYHQSSQISPPTHLQHQQQQYQLAPYVYDEMPMRKKAVGVGQEMADKLVPSLTVIDMIKHSPASTNASEQDLDEKAENAIDGPETRASTEEDHLLPKKEYYSDVWLASLEHTDSIFDEENYDEDEEAVTNEKDGGEPHMENPTAPLAIVRLRLPTDQTGDIIGKGGHVINDIQCDTWAHIHMLKDEHLPCANSNNDVLQISGEASDVKKALFQVSYCLYNRSSRLQNLSFYIGSHANPYQYQYDGLNVAEMDMDTSASKDFSLCLVCPSVNIGRAIGEGRNETKVILLFYVAVLTLGIETVGGVLTKLILTKIKSHVPTTHQDQQIPVTFWPKDFGSTPWDPGILYQGSQSAMFLPQRQFDATDRKFSSLSEGIKLIRKLGMIDGSHYGFMLELHGRDLAKDDTEMLLVPRVKKTSITMFRLIKHNNDFEVTFNYESIVSLKALFLHSSSETLELALELWNCNCSSLIYTTMHCLLLHSCCIYKSNNDNHEVVLKIYVGGRIQHCIYSSLSYWRKSTLAYWVAVMVWDPGPSSVSVIKVQVWFDRKLMDSFLDDGANLHVFVWDPGKFQKEYGPQSFSKGTQLLGKIIWDPGIFLAYNSTYPSGSCISKLHLELLAYLVSTLTLRQGQFKGAPSLPMSLCYALDCC